MKRWQKREDKKLIQKEDTKEDITRVYKIRIKNENIKRERKKNTDKEIQEME